jgi:ABC-type uncharacterized transport system ATPase subunit
LASLRLTRIDKYFGAVRAVHQASLEISPGRIHAVVGENGAGKSTFLKIAAGILEPDGGEVAVDGEKLTPHTAAEAIARGVGMVQQHFALIPVFTALENVMLGTEPLRGFDRLDFEAARKKTEAVAAELGAKLPLDARVESLGVGDRQRLEIARALYRDARILILDEPTAVLTPAEAEALYTTLRRLANGGRAVVVVTHKLDEVQGHADAATVLRKGEVVLTRTFDGPSDRAAEMTKLAEAIMGEKAPPEVHREAGKTGGARLVIDGLELGRSLLGVSLEVKAGEVVGIAGVEGNGQRELVRVLAGLDKPDAGSVRIEDGGAAVVVHEDRQAEGLVLDAPVRDNLVLGELARFSRFQVLDTEQINREASARAQRVRIEPPNLDTLARALSGGNQQKIVTARAVARAGPNEALIVAHPTRGVDMGAARTIHAQLLEVAQAGTAVLVISADLHELHTLCDRILVMARGRVVGSFAPTASDAEIGAAMLATTARAASLPPPAA